MSPIATHPVVAGNRSRILQLSEWARCAGYDVHLALLRSPFFLPSDLENMKLYWGEKRLHPLAVMYPNRLLERASNICRRRASKSKRWQEKFNSVAKLELDRWYFDWWTSQLAKLHHRFNFDVVVVEYIFASKAFQAFSKSTLKILDTHDCFSVRESQLSDAGINASWWSASAAEEGKALDRADIVLAIQEQEAEMFRKITASTVVTVSHASRVYPEVESEDKRLKLTLLTIGSDYPVNADGVAWMCEKVLHPLWRGGMALEYRIVGDVCGRLARLAGVYPFLQLLGRVESLSEQYKIADAVVNPVRAGTGIAIKSLEALAYGKPLVASLIGARSLGDRAKDALLLFHDEETCSESISYLYRNPPRLIEMGKAARRFAVDWEDFQKKAFYSVINSR